MYQYLFVLPAVSSFAWHKTSHYLTWTSHYIDHIQYAWIVYPTLRHSRAFSFTWEVHKGTFLCFWLTWICFTRVEVSRGLLASCVSDIGIRLMIQCVPHFLTRNFPVPYSFSNFIPFPSASLSFFMERFEFGDVFYDWLRVVREPWSPARSKDVQRAKCKIKFHHSTLTFWL
jgi:hypothetical protein